MYKENKDVIDEMLFDGRTPITEKVIRYYLKEQGVLDENIEHQPEIGNCPFNKNGVHNADYLLKSEKGEELYIEIKGQMTYSEVNKLKFLHQYSSKSIYILQLTEIDWIEEYLPDSNQSKMQKSKSDFDIQLGELMKFYHGQKTAKQMATISKRRLKKFLKIRKQDINRWQSQLNRND